MADFLASVERRAFKQAVFAVKNDESALDIVQDCMMRLVEKYSTQTVEELPLLFQRILQNAIRDWFRRSKVRSTWVSLFSSFGNREDEDEERDFLETLEVESNGGVANTPARQLEQSQILQAIEEAISRLPARQREAFVLRYWEEFDVEETADIMGCSEGSVKTHCFRAVNALSKILSSKGITLESVL